MATANRMWLVIFIFVFFSGDLSSPSLLAADTRWMQTGVRVWYMGAGNPADQEEAYLINGFDGDLMSVTRHSATGSWTSPSLAETNTYPRYDKGPFWIHPQVLANLQKDQTWMGQVITSIERKYWRIYTSNPEDPDNFPHHLLPAWALFKLSPQRLLAKIVCIIPYFSQSVAYFDAETGLLLYRDVVSVAASYNFILSEINYNFGTRRAFPEDNGPHTGYLSYLNETAWGAGAGMADIQSLVLTRYGNTMVMRVMTTLNGPLSPFLIMTTEQVCFFGDEPVPFATHKDYISAGTLPPEQWDPYGQYLWWWLPTAALTGTAIDVLGVPLVRVTKGVDRNFPASTQGDSGKTPSRLPVNFPSLTEPATHVFTAAGTAPTFYFSQLWFNEDGYLTLFSAQDPRIGLDVQADKLFQNNNSVSGLSYYRDHMGTAVPLPTQPLFLPLLLRH